MEKQDQPEQNQPNNEEEVIVTHSLESDMKALGVDVEEVQEETSEESIGEEPQKEEAEKKPKKTRSQRRIERQQDTIKELEAKLEKKESTPVVEKEELDIDDFENYDEYEEALEKQEEKSTEPEEEGTELTQRDKDIGYLFEDGAEEYEDFDKLVGADDLAISQDMLSEIIDSDKSVDLAYHLATHKDKAKEIAGMTPSKMRRELIKIELSLNNEKPKLVRQSKAPEPISPVTGISIKGKSLNDDDLSFEEHSRLLEEARGVSIPGGFI